ncbi:fibrinogen-like protein 1 [Drosophila tropicalis]|uniref:fibrinogen-like protein 1 n=1 Tax=Drosophila tropicalis TaxID=46794 RepID=UPI0035ABF18F
MLLGSSGLGAPRQSNGPILQQLSLIRHKITNLEINLYHVLSKVVFLTDEDVHNPRREQQEQEQRQKLNNQAVTESLKNMESLLQQLVASQICSENKTTVQGSNHTEEEKYQKEDEMVVINRPAKADCSELDDDSLSGVYTFLEPELNEIDRNFNQRFCIFATDGPAWTVIQNRGYKNYENFNRSWDDYRAGFGNLTKDFWFGNEFLHKILYDNDHLLRIELEDKQGQQAWAEYGLFRMDSEVYNYQLTIDEFQGTLPDGLEYHNKMDFSTFDHGTNKGVSCAVNSSSGWWFDGCQESNLNGDPETGGIMWLNWLDLKRCRMLIRPRHVTLEDNDIGDD